MKRLALILLLLAASALLAEATAPVTFEQRWAQHDPKWFELSIQPDGTATYRSQPLPDPKAGTDPEPYEQTFQLSPQSRQLVFNVAPHLRDFQGTLDKQKVAFTGTKTFRYSGATISYNFSTSPELTRLTSLMQGISETIETTQLLQSKLKFDKLSLDSTLRTTESLFDANRFAEMQLLTPTLTRIANDPSVLNIARQRARRILASAAKQK